MKNILTGRKILIVEDEEFNYFLIREILSEYNVKTPWAKSGLEALSMIKKDSNYNLILMDIKMPFLNGLETTKLIKRIHPNIPIIAQTACALAEERYDCFQAGCNGYLSKPFTSEELVNTLAESIAPKISESVR